jgi:uncharacterized cupredoxin-like copper-binding protein
MSRVGGGVAVVALCLVVACGGSSGDDGQGIDVGMQDFTLHPSAKTAQPGKITLHLLNRGPSTHEINVDRTDLAEDDLPLRPDGLSVAEDSPELSRIDSIEIVEAGDRATLHLDLAPGHYVLYCNLEGHYLGHMYTTLDVG